MKILFQKGHLAWNKGSRMSEATKELLRQKAKLRVGEKSSRWKGENAGNRSIHLWIERQLGKPTTCEHCGKAGLTKNQIHWANKGHTYQRILKDWIRLCVSCHGKIDGKYFI